MQGADSLSRKNELPDLSMTAAFVPSEQSSYFANCRHAQSAIIEVSPGTSSVPPTGYGGSERMIFGLAKGLSNTCDVIIMDFGPRKKNLILDGVKISIVRNPFRITSNRGLMISTLNAFTSAFLLFFELKKRGSITPCTVLHFHHGAQFAVFSILQRVFAREMRFCYVYSLHSPKWASPTLLSIWMRVATVPSELYAVDHSKLVTFESKGVVSGMATLHKLPHHFMVLQNGVDTDYFERGRYGTAREPWGVFYGARIKRQKDQLNVVRAMTKVTKKCPGARLLLVGDPEEADYFDDVKNEISRLGFRNIVKLLPSVDIDSLNSLRASYPVHVIFSSYTGFDVAVGETFSLGVACILSRIPALEGIAEHGKNCLLVPAKDPDALAEAILELFGDKALRETICQGARSTAVEKLSWASLSKAFLRECVKVCPPRQEIAAGDPRR